MEPLKGSIEEAPCVFCGHGDNVKDVCGKLWSCPPQTKRFAAHHKCMQYSAKLTQFRFDSFGGFLIDDVENEESRGRKKVCSSQNCQAVSRTGATSQCAWSGCLKPFHFICAHKENLTSKRKREERKKGKKELVYMFLVFCNNKHKREYLKAFKEGENLSADENEESGDRNSGRACSVVEDKDRGTDLESPRRSQNGRNMVQKTDDSDEASLGSSASPPDADSEKKESESARTSSQMNSNVPSTNVEMLPMPSGNLRRTEDNSEEEALFIPSSSNRSKRKCDTRTRSPPEKKRSKQSKSTKVRRKSRNREQSRSHRRSKIEKRGQKKPAVDDGRKSTSDTDSSDLSVETKDSSDSTSNLSWIEPPSKNSHLLADDSDDEGSPRQTSKINLAKPSLENLSGASENPRCFVDCSSSRKQSSCRSQMKDLNDKRSQKPKDGKNSNGQNSSSASVNEFLMILAAFSNEFKTKKAEVCQHLADQWKTDITHVYIWSEVAPVIVEEEIMLNFIASITEAANYGQWKKLRLLLLDAKTIQNTREELQGKSTVLENPESHQFNNIPINAAVKSTTAVGVHCVILEINTTTDPLHLIRDSLQKPYLFPLQKDTAFTFKSQRLRNSVLEEEFSVLKMWFTSYIQNVQKAFQHPSDEILYMPGAENDELYAMFMSEVQQLINPENEVLSSPVVVFAGNLNYDIIIFEQYLEAFGKKMLTDHEPHPVICILPVSNLKAFYRSRLEVPFSCWSAFDPALKPINYIVVTLD